MSITRLMSVTQVAPLVARSTAEFRYDRKDPFAVAIAFATDDEEITWVFARDLLDRGMSEHAGIGDVRLWPEGDRLILALSSDNESAQVSFDAAEVRRFLAATHRAVPRGEESVDLDGLIVELLRGA